MASSPQELTYRAATPDDAPRIAALVVAGFETYRPFAPPGWNPPSVEQETANVTRVLGKPGSWCRLAEDGSELAGHVGVMAMEDARMPLDEPGIAHFWQLFVRRAWWGSGLAARLHDAAIEAAGQRGHTGLRLFTPADHGRGRRFYEREGWTLFGEPFFDETFGMTLADYRRSI